MVRPGFLRSIASLLVAVALLAAMARPCAARASMQPAAMAMAGMPAGVGDCHDGPSKAMGRHGAAACLHCAVFGCGAVLPAAADFGVARHFASVEFWLPPALPPGLQVSPDTGPPRRSRS